MFSTLRATVLALPVTAALALGAAAQQPAPKFAYINSQRILAEAPGRAEAEQLFQRELGGYQKEVKRMGDSLQAMIAAYQKAEATLSPAAKEGRQKEIRTHQTEYQQRTEALDKRAAAREAELTRPILDKIQAAIEAERAESGYSFIFDAGTNSGVIVAADKNLDITDRVLARLRTTAQANPVTPAAPLGAPTGASVRPSGATATPAGATRPKSPPSDR